jgi:uncharacterized protein (DUF362 family)
MALWPEALRNAMQGSALALQFRMGRARSVEKEFSVNGRPLLVAVEGNDLVRMLAAVLKRFPTLDGALKGKRVLIKPNATASEPYPVTTDVLLLKAVVERVKRAAAAEITISDSSSFAGLANDRVFTKLGYYQLGKEQSVKTAAIDSQVGCDYVRVSHPNWRTNAFLLTDRRVNQADFVINLAIPKRHHIADFSCALKNNFGCTYGTFRMLAHARGEAFFDDSLVEFADAVRPNLTIVDARLILAKFGPGFRPGKSEIIPANRLVLSADMVAMDSYCGRLMEKLDRTFSSSNRLERQLNYAQSLGLGEHDPAKVEIIEI